MGGSTFPQPWYKSPPGKVVAPCTRHLRGGLETELASRPGSQVFQSDLPVCHLLLSPLKFLHFLLVSFLEYLGDDHTFCRSRINYTKAPKVKHLPHSHWPEVTNLSFLFVVATPSVVFSITVWSRWYTLNRKYLPMTHDRFKKWLHPCYFIPR